MECAQIKKDSKNTGRPLPRGRRYLLLMLYVPLYLTAFFLLQGAEGEFSYVHIPVDDAIQFCEYFVLPYCAWYFIIAGTGIFMLIRDKAGFKKYMYFMMIGYTICLAAYVIYPTGQRLRPELSRNDNGLIRLVSLIYSIDPPNNVLPSMHVVGSFYSAAAIIMSPAVKKIWIKWSMGILCLMAAVSTVFVKQHSALDGMASLVICIPTFLLLYGPWGKEKWRQLSPPAQKRWVTGGAAAMGIAVWLGKYVVAALSK